MQNPETRQLSCLSSRQKVSFARGVVVGSNASEIQSIPEFRGITTHGINQNLNPGQDGILVEGAR